MDQNMLNLLATSGHFLNALQAAQTPTTQPQMFSAAMYQQYTQALEQELLRNLAMQQLQNQLLSQAAGQSLFTSSVLPVKSTSPPTMGTVSCVPHLMLPTRPASEEVGTVPKRVSPHPVLSAALSTSSSTDRSTAPPSRGSAADDNCPSPSTSKKEDEDIDLFVDVESVDNRLEGKDRRKAHIEFYRKIKSIRQRDKILQCAICHETINNNDNAIIAHISVHGEAGGYRCKICGWDGADKYKIYEHMRKLHQHKATLIEDRRDMQKLCVVITECFPRACTRTKKDLTNSIDQLIKYLNDKKITSLKCGLCDKMVVATKSALTKHAAQTHPSYRCKTCKFTTEDEKVQQEHQSTSHSAEQPKNTVDYNVCTAVDVMTKVMKKCFSLV